jgi:hypothetical protein
MKSAKIYRLLLITACFLPPAGCANLSHPPEEKLVGQLPDLTTAVEVLVRHPVSGKPVPADQLVTEVYKKRPDLESAFGKYKVRVRPGKKYVVLLVCSSDGKYAKLEDLSSTPWVDKQWFKDNPQQTAEFTMDPDQGTTTCPRS